MNEIITSFFFWQALFSKRHRMCNLASRDLAEFGLLAKHFLKNLIYRPWLFSPLNNKLY